MAPLDFNAPTAEEAAEIRRRKAAITRRIRKEVLAELGIDRLPKRGERTLVTGGARHRQEQDLRRDHRRRSSGASLDLVACAEPGEGRRAGGEYNRLRTTDSLLARVVRGRGALDPRTGRDAMCPRHEVVNAGRGRWA